jgi:hypothetical protein
LRVPRWAAGDWLVDRRLSRAAIVAILNIARTDDRRRLIDR